MQTYGAEHDIKMRLEVKGKPDPPVLVCSRQVSPEFCRIFSQHFQLLFHPFNLSLIYIPPSVVWLLSSFAPDPSSPTIQNQYLILRNTLKEGTFILSSTFTWNSRHFSTQIWADCFEVAISSSGTLWCISSSPTVTLG